MQAILLCAGKGVRMHPLTLDRPKPLLRVGNEAIIDYTLRQLDGIVDEVIIVVGYKKEMIERHLKGRAGMRIVFAEQKEQLGTGHAVMTAAPHITGDFLVLNGDDIYVAEDIRKLLTHDYAVLVIEHGEPERFGIYEYKERGARRTATKIVEKPAKPKSNLVNIGCYKFKRDVLDFTIGKSPRGEYELTDFVAALIKAKKEVVLESASRWIPIGYPWDLLAANAELLRGQETRIDGTVEENVMIKGAVQVGQGTLVKSGTYIEGPVRIGKGCTVGPNAYLRASTSIGDGCKVGFEVEIKNSVIGDRTNVPHLAYVGDSVIGDDVNFAVGCITANYRFDAGRIRSSVDGELVDVGTNKFGTVIGDNAKLGARTLIYPGRKIWPGKTTLPGSVVKEDVL